MYTTYQGKIYVIEAHNYYSSGEYYDLGDPDGRRETIFNIRKENCSEPRDLYDPEEE